MRRQREMKKELQHLFMSIVDGRPHLPFVVDPTYTSGYVALLKTSMPLDCTVTFVAGGDVQFLKKKASSTQVAEWEAKCLARMQRVVAIFLEAAWGEDFVAAMEPFDVVGWADQNMDEGRDGAELVKTLQPLADLVKVEAVALKNELVSVRHHTLRLVRTGVPWASAWKRTLHAYQDRPLKNLTLALYPAFSAILGTGMLESNFTHQQLKGSHRHAGKAQELLHHVIKIRLNGPPQDEFCRVVQGARGPTYVPGRTCLVAQSIYANLFGSKVYRSEVKLGEGAERWHYKSLGSTVGPRAGSKQSFLATQAAQRRQVPGQSSASEAEAVAMHAAVEASRMELDQERAQEFQRQKELHPKKCPGMELLDEAQVKVKIRKTKEASRLAAKKMLQERDPDIKKKLQQHRAQESKRRDLAVVHCSPSSSSKVCSMTFFKKTKVFAVSASLRKLAEKVFPKENVHRFLKESVEEMVIDTKSIKMWLVPGCAAEEFKKDIVLQNDGDDSREDIFPHLCARLYGGFVADEEWLARAKANKEILAEVLSPST